MQNIILPKVRRYSVYVPGPNKKCIETDNINYAEKHSILNAGTVFDQTRYNAIKRLQRRYYQLALKNKLPVEIDYPALIKIQ